MSEAYKRAGAKAKRDWRRSISTAKPGHVYNYYADVSAIFEHWVVSPSVQVLDQETGLYQARFTLYLGAYSPDEIVGREGMIAEQKLLAYLQPHGSRVVSHTVHGVFRHFRGSPL